MFILIVALELLMVVVVITVAEQIGVMAVLAVVEQDQVITQEPLVVVQL